MCTSTKTKLLLCMSVISDYFSLSTQLVCMSGRVHLTAFLSINKVLNHFFSFCAEIKKNIYYINLELQEQTT